MKKLLIITIIFANIIFAQSTIIKSSYVKTNYYSNYYSGRGGFVETINCFIVSDATNGYKLTFTPTGKLLNYQKNNSVYFNTLDIMTIDNYSKIRSTGNYFVFTGIVTMIGGSCSILYGTSNSSKTLILTGITTFLFGNLTRALGKKLRLIRYDRWLNKNKYK